MFTYMHAYLCLNVHNIGGIRIPNAHFEVGQAFKILIRGQALVPKHLHIHAHIHMST